MHCLTVNDFIYQTPSVAFSNPFMPLIIYSEAMNIKEDSEKLDKALDNLFSYLLFRDEAVGNTINVKVGCSYGYQLTATSNGSALNGDTTHALKTYLPLRLMPRFDFQLTDQWRTTFTSHLAEMLIAWEQNADPSKENGGFYFNICIYAGEAGEVEQPLLEIRNLYYPL